MAASYSTDLTTLTANETNGMVEPTATGWTNLNAFASAETDYFIQGVACTSATMKVGVGGALTNNTAFTLGTDDAVLCWAYYWAPGGMDTEANGGARQMIGSAQNAFYWVSQSGSDDWYLGGWRCFAMGNPSQITVNTVGSPTTSYAYTGWAANLLTIPGKGNPFGVDAVRKGRCQIKVTGSTGTFTEIEEFNSKNSTAARTGFTLLDSGYHRLGLFQYQNGSYLWKGKLLLGETGVASVGFSDSNKTILVENTKNVTANFNLIELQHTGSTLSWTGISITALGTVSKGRFLVTDAPSSVSMTGCTFTDMDSFTFHASGTQSVSGCVFRRCGIVTQGSASIDATLFDKATGTKALIASSISGVTNCDFVSSGTGYAIEGFSTAGDYSVATNTFTGYATALPSDQYWGDVSLAMHMDGTNGSTTFTDEKGKTVAAAGNAQISTAQSKFGGASALFDGTGDYLSITDVSSSFAFGTGSFTVEFFVRPSSIADQYDCLIDFRSADPQVAATIYLNYGKPMLWVNGGQRILSATALTVGTWYHIALCRSGTSTKLFVDGAQVGSTYTDSNNYVAASAIKVGIAFNASLGYAGYIDDLRITKGVARYTSTFSVPSEAFPTTSGSDGPNAALHVLATTGTVNINAPGGTSVQSEGATVNIISGQRTLTLTGIVSGSDIVILSAGTTTELANIDANSGSTYAYSYTYAANTYIDVCVYKQGYVPFTVRNYLLADGDGSLPISQVTDRNYVP